MKKLKSFNATRKNVLDNIKIIKIASFNNYLPSIILFWINHRVLSII